MTIWFDSAGSRKRAVAESCEHNNDEKLRVQRGNFLTNETYKSSPKATVMCGIIESPVKCSFIIFLKCSSETCPEQRKAILEFVLSVITYNDVPSTERCRFPVCYSRNSRAWRWQIRTDERWCSWTDRASHRRQSPECHRGLYYEGTENKDVDDVDRRISIIRQ